MCGWHVKQVCSGHKRDLILVCTYLMSASFCLSVCVCARVCVRVCVCAFNAKKHTKHDIFSLCMHVTLANSHIIIGTHWSRRRKMPPISEVPGMEYCVQIGFGIQLFKLEHSSVCVDVLLTDTCVTWMWWRQYGPIIITRSIMSIIF